MLAFADFFRHTLHSPQDFITIREELEYPRSMRAAGQLKSRSSFTDLGRGGSPPPGSSR